jgi:mannose-6-phosphate isomerase
MSIAPGPDGRVPPVALEPVLLDKPWGGASLARWGFPVAPGARIGEAWMFADIGVTAQGGAGGGAFHSVIRGGPTKRYSLRDAALDWPGGLVGTGADAEHPLLVKLLDAREHLSVQVHPSPAYAASHPGARLKAESWFVLHADPGAELFLGVQSGVTADDVVELAAAGRLPEVLVRVPAHAGDCHTLPSGLIHAMGAGVVVAEVQTASDTTFRLYDWAREYGRAGRPLHLSEAREAMLADARPVTVSAEPARNEQDAGDRVVATTAHFTVRHRWLPRGAEAQVPAGAIVLAVSGLGSLGGEDVTVTQAVFARDGGTLVTPPHRPVAWLEATLGGVTPRG